MNSDNEYYNTVFNNIIKEYEDVTSDDEHILLENELPKGFPKLVLTINTSEFKEAQNNLKLTNHIFTLVKINNITDTKVFLVCNNSKYYVISLFANNPSTIYEYLDPTQVD